MLVSDGEENETPTMSDLVPFIVDADVRVVSIAFGYNYIMKNETKF